MLSSLSHVIKIGRHGFVYLMCVCSHRNSKGSREAKICEFEIIFLVDEEVLGLEVAMQNSMGVAVQKASVELMGKSL